MEILVFRTNIATPEQRNILKTLMGHLREIEKWNLDIWDTDNVLRIESNTDCSNNIIHHLQSAGFECAPLED